MTVLVTGGAGYIGSVVVDQLVGRGESVLVIDNLSRSAEPKLPDGAAFICADVGDTEAIRDSVDRFGVDRCIHLAGLTAVGESARNPGLYLESNVAQTVRLLQSLVDSEVPSLVFSSSAAVYGAAANSPITEDEPLAPTSPYGWTKMAVEHMLQMHSEANGIRSVSLRYFNAAGATAIRHEAHDPETHLIPLAFKAALDPNRPLTVFGSDYPTTDGTATRDYVHVDDLASAHLLALDYLQSGGGTTQLNLGTGKGHTVLQVIAAIERALGQPVALEPGGRRPGDPPSLVASPERARQVLGWLATRSSLDQIIDSVVAYDNRRDR